MKESDRWRLIYHLYLRQKLGWKTWLANSVSKNYTIHPGTDIAGKPQTSSIELTLIKFMA